MHASASRADVARKAGVAESTVSRALSGSPLISKETRRAVEQAAQSLGYIPNKQAAIFATQKTRRIGIVVPVHASFPPFSRAYFPALLNGVVMGSEKQGYSVTIVLDGTKDGPKDLLHLVRAREVDGLVFAITRNDDSRLETLRNQKIPFVLTNSVAPGCHCVDNNPGPGMQKAFDYLISMGHQSVGYISGDPHYHNAQERLEIFRKLSVAAGIQTTHMEGNFSKTSGYYCAAKLLQGNNRPSLIMTSSDREAIGVLHYCRDHGIAVPGEVSIIGYDNLDPSEFLSPSLTTVDNPVVEIGEASAELLIDQIENGSDNPITKELDTDFIVRESSGPCRKETRGKEC